jgi:GxxExxY protein
MSENELAKEAVNIAFKIHMELGPGLLESVYEEVFAFELKRKGIQFTRQQAIPVIYDAMRLELGFRTDLILENKLIVEIKSVESLIPVHKKQVMTYLKLTKIKLWLLINFNVPLIKEGLHRIVNGL